eukprot:8741655-Lingulodinium_polyedra.AAC.1
MLDEAAFWFGLRMLGDTAFGCCGWRSEPSRVATKVLSKVTVEILSSGTFEVQAALLSKLTTIFRDPTAEAQLSEQCRKDLSDIHKMLALYRNEPVDGIDVQQFIMAAKSCTAGPVFHLRVSKLGVKIFAQLATAASSE